ncbi:unnamed protein product [Schistosoma mattheei]|uniref:Corrinoid adenosyltransferase MMAB n=1 Tax=Schistosoma mattheei TaxID=31246 RepID=A0A183Q508_9TREM|nr:unnamed protein product [Schistosoma mattheei]
MFYFIDIIHCKVVCSSHLQISGSARSLRSFNLFRFHSRNVYLGANFISHVPKRTVKIYTRTGDNGTSSLFTGERRPKNDPVFDALGTVDELACCIGLASAHIHDHISRQLPGYDVLTVLKQLEQIQCRLLGMSSSIATPLPRPENQTDISERPKRYKRVAFPEDVSVELEQWIDNLTNALPPLKVFILPSGGTPGSSLQLARAVCRRAERCIISMNLQHEYPVVEESVVKYLNRLSDYLFTAARYITNGLGFTEKTFLLPNTKSKK